MDGRVYFFHHSSMNRVACRGDSGLMQTLTCCRSRQEELKRRSGAGYHTHSTTAYVRTATAQVTLTPRGAAGARPAAGTVQQVRAGAGEILVYTRSEGRKDQKDAQVDKMIWVTVYLCSARLSLELHELE